MEHTIHQTRAYYSSTKKSFVYLVFVSSLFQACAALPAASGVSRRWVNQTGESTKPLAREFINYPNHTCRAGHLLLRCPALSCAEPSVDSIIKRAPMST